MYKKLYFIGFAVFAILFAFSIQFAKERIIFIDMACNLFNIIANNGFTINHYRFGDTVSQLFPIIAMKAGLPLSTLINYYSAGYIIYSLIAYIICGSVLKRYDFALVVLFQNVLFSSDTFYALSQLPQSITLIILIFAIITGKTFKTLPLISKAITALLLVTVVFFHPLSIFVVLFSVMYFMLNKDLMPGRQLLYTLVILYFAVLIFKFLAMRTPYESHSMSGMKNFITQFPDYITLYSNKRFLINCLTRYYWIPILFAANTVFYARRKEWEKLWFFILAFTGYLGLVNISYPTIKTPVFYIENLYLPLGIFLSLPFVFEVMPGMNNKKLAMGMILLISATGLIRIYNTHNLYTTRLNYYRQIIQEYGEKKVVMDTKNTNMNILMMAWGTPYEFLLLSESEHNRPASIIIDEHPERLKWAEGHKSEILVNWNIFQHKDMPKRYFHFTDTTTGYEINPKP
jgi:hypothetical protein